MRCQWKRLRLRDCKSGLFSKLSQLTLTRLMHLSGFGKIGRKKNQELQNNSIFSEQAPQIKSISDFQELQILFKLSHVPLELSMKTSISQAPVRSSNDVCPFCHYPLSLIGCAACSSWRGARPRNSAAALNPDPCFHPLVADLPLFPLLIVQICPPTSP